MAFDGLSTGKVKAVAGLRAGQEKLICAHIDGECGMLGRWRVKRLLTRSKSARQFYKGLRRTSLHVERVLGRSDRWNIGRNGDDLWMRVSARIAQEERAEILLGSRELHTSWREPLYDRIKWGLSGAVVAACAAVIWLGLPAPSSTPAGKVAQQVEPPQLTIKGPEAALVAQVAFEAKSEVDSGSGRGVSGVEGRPNFPEGPIGRQRNPRVIEVDWMKSSGRVKLIQHPEEKAAIIWVKPGMGRSIMPSAGAGYSVERAASGGRASAGQPIKILEDNIPVARSAFDR